MSYHFPEAGEQWVRKLDGARVTVRLVMPETFNMPASVVFELNRARDLKPKWPVRDFLDMHTLDSEQPAAVVADLTAEERGEVLGERPQDCQEDPRVARGSGYAKAGRRVVPAGVGAGRREEWYQK